METRPPSIGSVLVTVLFALSCFVATVYVWRAFGGSTPLSPTGYEIHASFEEAATLTPNADVRIAGIPVGKVVRLRPQGLRTEVVIRLKRQYAPLPRDARAILRSKTLLCETYVELTPGTPNAPKLPEGDTIQQRHVEPTQQLDQVLGAFDRPTRDSFKRFLADLSTSLAGRGLDVSGALANAAPATEELTKVVVVADRQGAAVRRLVRDTGTVLRALGRRGAELQRLVVAGEQVLSATAGRDRELTATVNELAPLLAELRATLGPLDRTTAEAAPTLAALRPVTPLIEPGLREAARLAP